MYYLNKGHKLFYEEISTEYRIDSLENLTCIYLFSAVGRNISEYGKFNKLDDIYSNKKGHLNIKNIKNVYSNSSSSERALILLAVNLYNDSIVLDGHKNISISRIFDMLGREYTNVVIQALILYNSWKF